MELLLCGEWLRSSGILKSKIKGFRVFDSLKEIQSRALGFLIVPFSKSSESMKLDLKKYGFEKVILIEIEDFEGYFDGKNRVKLIQISQSIKREDFIKKIEEVKRLIKEGDIYQLNLTNRFDFELIGDGRSLFLRFIEKQPVPFGFYLKLDGLEIISGSMELFLKKEGNRLTSCPIKGTAKSMRELALSKKDKAENLMIVDIVRNDLARVSKPGSVKVDSLFELKSYSTLYQMVSCVSSITELGIPEILLNTFPPASVVGAPKRRALEIIDSLEPHPRGFYCGCAGILKGDEFILSVLIRTSHIVDSVASYFAGAGIVFDSNEEKEWEEVNLKTEAFRI